MARFDYGYVPSVAAHEEGELPPGYYGDDVTVVEYVGTSNVRTLTRADLCGDKDVANADDYLSWDRGNAHRLPFSALEEMAGSAERVHQVLAANVGEFQVVGPEAKNAPEVEEFSIGGTVSGE